MSDWESFCVPLVEAMYFKVPIIAYSSSVIPETLGNRGILIKHKNFKKISEMIDDVIKNKDFIVVNQTEQLKVFKKENIKKRLLKIMRALNESK